MAVLEEVPGIKVTVRIDGVDCQEYDDPQDPDQPPACPKSSKYIESRDDAKFTIYLTVDRGYKWGYKKHVLSFSTYVDNIWVRDPLLNEHYLETEIEGRQSFSNASRSWVLQGLKFSTVKIVENTTKERFQEDKKLSDEPGMIEVRVRRCIKVQRSHTVQDHTRQKSSFELAEKSLKGKSISHGTTFSNNESIDAPTLWNTVPVDGDNTHIAIFQFKYRSKEALQHEMIIPRTPTPPLSLETLSEADRDRLARERLEQIEAERSIKKEADRPVKRENDEVVDLTQGGIRAKKPRIEVDLTGDSEED
ncbi:hypothetical protein M426DRAFT_17181 [Hypoxylon sp. CI-4A]|nr:hypothetical protein M426DRAFT_17181 [Hypoxylon sp. CI-4A]